MTYRRRLSKELAKHFGFKIKPKDGSQNPRYYLNDAQLKELHTLTDTKPKQQHQPKRKEKPFVLSAWNDKGYMMEIDEYCEHYNLPRKDIKSYKLVSHTGTPFYNILFKENVEFKDDLTQDYIEKAIAKHIKPIHIERKQKRQSKTFDRLIFSDVHIGMTPNKNGFSLYGGKWDEQELNSRLNDIIQYVLENQQSNELYIDDLGDFLDGWDGQTVRKGHSLPQNMDNEKAFDVAVSFKVRLLSSLVWAYDTITMNNVCEDNHAGSFGYVVNSAVKQIMEIKHPNCIKVLNHRKFIAHYIVGNHAFVISHGKDSKNLKFGFKPVLDTKQIEKIDQYLKHNGIYKDAEYIEFSKGDSHQFLLDYCTSDDFDYFNYPALSPSSEWVQTNFKKGRSGFVMQIVSYEYNEKKILPYFFKF